MRRGNTEKKSNASYLNLLILKYEREIKQRKREII